VEFDLSVVGKPGEVARIEWTQREVILYALGVGAGQADASAELQFTTENSDGVELQVLPGFAVAQAMARARRPKVGDIPLANVLHGEQSFVYHEPMRASGAADAQATVVGIYDHGSAGHVVTDITLTDEKSGRPLLTTTSTIVVRGEGGFGGERRPSQDWDRPVGTPDVTVDVAIRTDQALLYRLSGDRNPLHSDPTFAKRAGFDRPILHGLCTFGVTGRVLVNEVCGGDASAVGAMGGRFSKPVMPGDTLTVKAWGNDATCQFVVEDSSGAVVLDRGHFAVRGTG
jgi:acyl dehydratase